MKKFLVVLIIILLILLTIQLAYFNLTKENRENEKNNINSTEINQIGQINENSLNIYENIYEEKNDNEDDIEFNGLEEIMKQYTGKITIDFIKEQVYTFTNTNLNKMYDMANRKSNNKILQMYDLETESINEMNIYSSEDFFEIVRQIFLVGNVKSVKCTSCNVEENSYNSNESGYTTFDIILNFDSSNNIKLKVYLANEETSNPSFKFGKID